MSSRRLRSKKEGKSVKVEDIKEVNKANGKEDVKNFQAKIGDSNEGEISSHGLCSKEEGKSVEMESVEKSIEMDGVNKENGKEDVKNLQAKIGDSDEGTLSNSKKRAGEECNLPVVKRKKIRDSSSKQSKNAISQLHELNYDAKYVFDSESGPSHSPTFVCSTIINGKEFTGKGSSKKLAKHAAAEAALKSFIQLRDASKIFKAPGSETSAIDFTDDNVGNADFIQNQSSESIGESVFVQSKIDKKVRKLQADVHKKSPLVLLNEIHPGLRFIVVDENRACPDERFVMNVTVDGAVFDGTGPTKKAAKVAVAQKILTEKYNFNFDVPANEPMELIAKEFEFPQQLADKMAAFVHSTMTKLVSENKKNQTWEVLASVVMTTDPAMEDMKVICLATGSGILNGEEMSLIGAVLTDCHAEVLARRCLKDFLFTQLELYVADKPEKSIFDKIDGKFKLKPNIKFHFYSTNVPCGAAREGNSYQANKQQNIKFGKLRTKAESGSDTIVVGCIKREQNVEDITAKRAVYQVMSCSDKMAIWNVLGIQGSLLNYFIEPIYFYTIILGQTCQLSLIAYSMFSRIEQSLKTLPSPFSLHKPQIAASLTTVTKPSEESQKISMNWTCGLNKPELLVESTGKPTGCPLSRLTKRSFFQRFCSLYDVFLKTPALSHFYDSVKKASPDYQQAKEVILQAFVSSGFGTWKKKPKEQDAFELAF